MKFLQDVLQDRTRECIILAEILQNLVRITLFSQVSYKSFARTALSSQCFVTSQSVSDTFLYFPLQKCSKRLFRRRQDRSYPTGRDKNNFGKTCFTMYFYSDKLTHYKTYDFEKFLILGAFKHV